MGVNELFHFSFSIWAWVYIRRTKKKLPVKLAAAATSPTSVHMINDQTMKLMSRAKLAPACRCMKSTAQAA